MDWGRGSCLSRTKDQGPWRRGAKVLQIREFTTFAPISSRIYLLYGMFVLITVNPFLLSAFKLRDSCRAKCCRVLFAHTFRCCYFPCRLQIVGGYKFEAHYLPFLHTRISWKIQTTRGDGNRSIKPTPHHCYSEHSFCCSTLPCLTFTTETIRAQPK